MLARIIALPIKELLAVLRELTRFPVIVDPSHAAGQARYVPALARAAVACGVDGLFMEVHEDPDRAPSDGPNMVRMNTLSRRNERFIVVFSAIDPKGQR